MVPRWSQMLLSWQIHKCQFYTFQIFYWCHLRAGDVNACDSEVDSPFNFDLEDLSESSPICKPDELQFQVMLEDLALMQSMLLQIWGHLFDHEKSQWTEDKLYMFLNPLQEPWNLDNPQLHLSFWIYLSLSAHSSRQHTMQSTQVSLNAILWAPCSHLTRFKVDWKESQASFCYTSICVSILALILTKCPFCNPRILYRQFVTLPIGPQLQTLWQHPISVSKLQDHVWCTTVLLMQYNTDGGIQDYYNVCCGSEYLDLDIFLIMTCFSCFLWMGHNFTKIKHQTHDLVLLHLLALCLKFVMQQRWSSQLLWSEVPILPNIMTPFFLWHLLISPLSKALVFRSGMLWHKCLSAHVHGSVSELQTLGMVNWVDGWVTMGEMDASYFFLFQVIITLAWGPTTPLCWSHMVPYLLYQVTLISISMQSPHPHWTSTMRGFIIFLAPCSPVNMRAIIKKLGYASHPLHLHF